MNVFLPVVSPTPCSFNPFRQR